MCFIILPLNRIIINRIGFVKKVLDKIPHRVLFLFGLRTVGIEDVGERAENVSVAFLVVISAFASGRVKGPGRCNPKARKRKSDVFLLCFNFRMGGWGPPSGKFMFSLGGGSAPPP